MRSCQCFSSVGLLEPSDALPTSAPALPTACFQMSARLVLVEYGSDLSPLKPYTGISSCLKVQDHLRSGPCLVPTLFPLYPPPAHPLPATLGSFPVCEHVLPSGTLCLPLPQPEMLFLPMPHSPTVSVVMWSEGAWLPRVLPPCPLPVSVPPLALIYSS